MPEAIFEVRQILLAPCDHPTCSRWATVEIRLLGAPAWDFQRTCGYHKRWAKRTIIDGCRAALAARPTEAEAGA